MGLQRGIYQALKYYNDAKAIKRAADSSSAKPLVRRAGRRVYGKATGYIARKLFG